MRTIYLPSRDCFSFLTALLYFQTLIVIIIVLINVAAYQTTETRAQAPFGDVTKTERLLACSASFLGLSKESRSLSRSRSRSRFDLDIAITNATAHA